MEDNYIELNKNWKSLEESWNRVDETKSKKGLSKNDHQSATKGRATQVHKDKKKAFKRWKYKDGKRIEEVDEAAACGGMTAAGSGNIAGRAVVSANQGTVKQAGYAERLGKKKPTMRENFDLSTLGKPKPPMGGTPPMGKPMAKPMGGTPPMGKPPMGVGPVAEEPVIGAMEGMEDELDGGVGDVIAAIQARYPGAVIEITVCAPENHRFSDADLSHATEVANSSEAPEELGGAWEKSGGDEEGMEGEEDEGTKPFREEFAPYGGSKDKDSDGGDDEPEEKEEPADDEGDDKKPEKKNKKPSFGGGDDSEGGEGEEVDSHAGITEDSISMSPEAWSEFLGSVDMAGGDEEGMEGDMDEGEKSMSPEEQNDVKNGRPGVKPPRKPVPHDPTETDGGNEDAEPDMVDPRA